MAPIIHARARWAICTDSSSQSCCFCCKKKGQSYGYELAAELHEHALTDASIEAAALYKTLRQLEQNGCVSSKWDVTGNGPAKRVYCLTPHGEEHLTEWITVLDHVARSMTRFVRIAGKQSRDEVRRRSFDTKHCDSPRRQ